MDKPYESNGNEMQAATKSTNETVIDQAKKAAESLVGQTKDQLGSQLKTQKDEATTKLDSVANALRETSRHMGDQSESALPSYANQAADQVERLTEYVRSRTIGDLIGDVESFARREPAIFLGGSFALGLLAARFLKSSGHRAPAENSASSSMASTGTNRSMDAAGYDSGSYGGASTKTSGSQASTKTSGSQG